MAVVGVGSSWESRGGGGGGAARSSLRHPCRLPGPGGSGGASAPPGVPERSSPGTPATRS